MKRNKVKYNITNLAHPPLTLTTPKAPKVAPPSPFSGCQDDLDCFKAECWVYLVMRHTEFPDNRSKILFLLSFMKGGAAGTWVTQKINAILDDNHPNHLAWVNLSFDKFVSDKMDAMFADPNRQATTLKALAMAHQGDKSVEELICKFKIYGPASQLGNVGL